MLDFGAEATSPEGWIAPFGDALLVADGAPAGKGNPMQNELREPSEGQNAAKRVISVDFDPSRRLPLGYGKWYFYCFENGVACVQ